MKFFLLVSLVLLAGCAQPATPKDAPALPSTLLVIAHNNATAPGWFRFTLLENGNSVVAEEREVPGGAETTWQVRMEPGDAYHFGADYSATPTIPFGFGSSGDVNSTRCPGSVYVLRVWGALAQDGVPALSFRFADECASS